MIAFLAGWAIGIMVANGLQLPITESQLSEILFAIIIFIIGYLDSKYPNSFSFLGNTSEGTINGDDRVLNPEYE